MKNSTGRIVWRGSHAHDIVLTDTSRPECVLAYVVNQHKISYVHNYNEKVEKIHVKFSQHIIIMCFYPDRSELSVPRSFCCTDL